MNNKTNIIAKTLIAGLACVAFCGATLAAPHGGGKAPQKAPTHQKAPAPNGGNARAHNPAPAPHGAPVAHHAPAPAPHHHEPPPPAPHHGGHHEGAGWVALGATVIGGIVGGIIGACS